MISGRTIAGVVIAAMALAAQAADIYTWKDADGRVHFSDQPPTGKQDVRKVRSKEPAAMPVPAEQAKPAEKRSQADKYLEQRKRRAEAQEAADKAEKDKAAAERKTADCQSARNQLKALESGQRVSRFNDKGESIPMDDAERQAEIERSRQFVEKCP